MRANTQTIGHLSWAARARLTLIAGMTALSVMALAPLHAGAQSAKVAGFAQVPHAEKIHANLLDLDVQVQQRAMSLTQAASIMAMHTAGDGIRVDIVMTYVDDRVLDDMRNMGLSIDHVSATHRRVAASPQWLAISPCFMMWLRSTLSR